MPANRAPVPSTFARYFAPVYQRTSWPRAHSSRTMGTSGLRWPTTGTLPTRMRGMMAVDLTRTARALCWIASALLLAAYACVFTRYAVDFPRVDDYSQLLAVPYYVSLEPTAADALAYLLSLSVEHRIATLRLAALAQARYLGGLDFIALMALGAVVLALGVAVVVMQAPRAHRAWVALVAVALFVSPVHYEAQYWATGALQHEGVLGLALVALWLVARHNPVGIAVAC